VIIHDFRVILYNSWGSSTTPESLYDLRVIPYYSGIILYDSRVISETPG
jgi:hypothetical protein